MGRAGVGVGEEVVEGGAEVAESDDHDCKNHVTYTLAVDVSSRHAD